jgi:hypothetical protein
MKALSMCVLMSVAICAGQQVPWATFQPTPAPVQQMTNATVVQMVQAKISPDLIILAISKCEPHFLLDPGNGRYMLQMGVTDEMYKAMAARQIGKPIPGYTQAPAVAAPAAMASAVAAPAAMAPAVAAPQPGYIQPAAPQTAPPDNHSISKLSDGDVFFGFSYASADFNGLVPRQNMIGWETSSAFAFKKWRTTKLSAEGTANGFYDTQNSYWASLHNYTFAGGLRVDSGPVFVHYLVGVSHLTASSTAYEVSASQNALAMVIGGGFQFKVAGPLAFRTSVDYIMTRHDVFAPDTQNNFRMSAGLVFSVGGNGGHKL